MPWVMTSRKLKAGNPEGFAPGLYFSIGHVTVAAIFWRRDGTIQLDIEAPKETARFDHASVAEAMKEMHRLLNTSLPETDE